ncbi:hypothetical protein BO83DRAFT_202477 [Aspergillus eucalypticola CBS 122712]|uniref:Uncharacterized protein n=1 Tax=Aspergillus eucalypticola (strain CBS 122712 / IBT 29274) TaxID=1448314 RepID=A0A317W393_ASPEC|nr:uncharacterized protein BO83DRAFT_202477 [Aspergillus eucalypticola CBS 122712]PWY80041.1 hypothetical protein BO83DRAFT_202477 [Aspergillus eucalypticola CBS 122712]
MYASFTPGFVYLGQVYRTRSADPPPPTLTMSVYTNFLCPLEFFVPIKSLHPRTSRQGVFCVLFLGLLNFLCSHFFFFLHPILYLGHCNRTS